MKQRNRVFKYEQNYELQAKRLARAENKYTDIIL